MKTSIRGVHFQILGPWLWAERVKEKRCGGGRQGATFELQRLYPTARGDGERWVAMCDEEEMWS
jgi:hypothetical protein